MLRTYDRHAMNKKQYYAIHRRVLMDSLTVTPQTDTKLYRNTLPVERCCKVMAVTQKQQEI